MERLETLASRLKQEAAQVAFIESDDGKILYARHSPAPHEPASAVTRLIQGLYSFDPANALRLVRKRIYTSSPLTSMCWGMLKVAAQRHSIIEARDHGAHVDLAQAIEVGPPPPDPLPSRPTIRPQASEREWIEAARLLALSVDRSGPRYASDRPVAALLVDADGRLIGAAVNSNARNRTLHAELKLLQEWHAQEAKPLPAGMRVYSSLKPCRMCAGMLWHAASRPRQLRIAYAEFDHGPNARETVLNARSPDRRRALVEDAREGIGLDDELEFQIS